MNVVFAIGCKRYSDPDVAHLKYADRDAKRFAETVLRTQDSEDTESYLLHDEHKIEGFRPTRSNILRFLSRGRNRDKSTELDFLFFYFSGHGWSSQDGTDYLLTSDSVVNMPEDTAISVPMLERHLRNWEAKHAVLFIDACRTVIAGGKRLTIQDELRIDVDSLCPPGMVTFCSCEPGQTSYEADPISSGVFTEGVCRALGDEGRCATIQELDRYLSNKVPKISRAYGLPPQTPYSRVEPLAVRNVHIVAQRVQQAWQGRKGGGQQISPGTTPQVESLSQYRQAVEWFWTGEELNEQDVQRLKNVANSLNVGQSDASTIERELMGSTKEVILKRQEQASRNEERQAQPDTLHSVEESKSPEDDNRTKARRIIREEIAEEKPDAAEAETGEDEVVIPVTEEEVVVEQRPVAKEEIRIRKDMVGDTENHLGPSKPKIEFEEKLQVLEDKYAGYTVYDNRGEKIGKVDDLFVSETDQPEYIGVKMGFLKRKFVLIPMDIVWVNEANKVLEVRVRKDHVQEAPTFGSDEDITPEYEARIRSHFGLSL